MRSALSPFRALIQGIADLVRAPLMLIGIAIVTLLIALPFAAILQSELQQSLSVQPPVSRAETEIDPEWWMEFREHARGLAATFTPAVLGFAATLDGLSGVLDGKRPAAAVLLPLLISLVAWAFIWGGALQRFQQQGAIGVRGFTRAGLRHLVSFVAISAAAAIVNVLLYLTVHALLFGPVHRALVAMTTTERDAFFVRAVLYVIFFTLVALVGLIADYARVAAVTGHAASVSSSIGASMRFVRGHIGSVIVLFVMTGAIFVAATTAYGVLEIYGGSQVGGWRAIAIGQAYVLVRLAIRLTFAASELRLFNANQTVAAQ